MEKVEWDEPRSVCLENLHFWGCATLRQSDWAQTIIILYKVINHMIPKRNLDALIHQSAYTVNFVSEMWSRMFSMRQSPVHKTVCQSMQDSMTICLEGLSLRIYQSSSSIQGQPEGLRKYEIIFNDGVGQPQLKGPWAFSLALGHLRMWRNWDRRSLGYVFLPPLK